MNEANPGAQAPATDVSKGKPEPIKMVKLTAHIPAGMKSIVLAIDRFTVPIIESVMFHGDNQVPKDALDKIHQLSKDPLNPMVGAFCRDSDFGEMAVKLQGHFTSKEFVKALKTVEFNVTDVGIEKATREYKASLKEAQAKRLTRIKALHNVIDSGRVIEEDITDLSAADLKKLQAKRSDAPKEKAPANAESKPSTDEG